VKSRDAWASCVLSVLLLAPCAAIAQERSVDIGAPRKQAQAVRVADGSIRLDGRLDDEAWRHAVPVTDFVQKEPNEGVPPTEETEVRIVYDDTALYVGARMHDRGHAGIQAPLGRRDDVEDQAEFFLVAFDTFQDRLTAYGFGVTATGVRIDRYYRRDDEANLDEGFDPVWQARTAQESDGWTAELWIPFSQLRFNERPAQVWGMNLQRSTPTLNEMDYWVPVPRTERGWASRFGDLRGIEGVRPTKRIEVLPYIAGASTVNSNRDPDNPFDDGRNLSSRLGADVKVGLGPSLTLEATVNPDFGQVEADPAEVNLSAVETTLSEKRPFFIEGATMLNPALANSYFYSRRIGARPTTSVSGDYVDYPTTANILTSAKLTGRLASGMSLGVLGAVTAHESARVSDRGSPTIEEVPVASQSTYGLVRVQQEFGQSASTVSAFATAVHRDLNGTPLAALLTHHAFSGGGDAILRFRGGQYQLRSYAGFSDVHGSPAAITRLQRSALHSFQRPDKDYAIFIPTRTSLQGYRTGGDFERTGGRHWLWSVSTDWESPGFETNDIGRLGSTDGIKFNYNLRYRETMPNKAFRTYSVGLAQTNEWNYGWNRQVGGAKADVNLTLVNFWTATLSTGPDFRLLSGRLTRGGPLMTAPGGWTTSGTLRSRSAAQVVWNGGFTATTDEAGGGIVNVNAGVSVRSPRWQFSVTPRYIQQTDTQQYVATRDGGRPETYGQRYIFGHIDRSTLSTQFRAAYTLRPDLNLDVYAEPFAASGRYSDVGELRAPRASDVIVYGTSTSGTTVSVQPDGSRLVTEGGQSFTLNPLDFNVRSFRSNVVLRWEWRPGSTLFLVWQQDRRGGTETGQHVGVGDLFGAFDHPGTNFFVVKTSFWLPVR
jgi:hypothetical protein